MGRRNGHGKVLVKVARLFMVALHALSRGGGGGYGAALRSAPLRSPTRVNDHDARVATRISHPSTAPRAPPWPISPAAAPPHPVPASCSARCSGYKRKSGKRRRVK